MTICLCHSLYIPLNDSRPLNDKVIVGLYYMVLPTLNYPILKYSRILLSHKKEIFTLCNSMDGPGEHYAKQNKPVRERQVPYDFTHKWNLTNKLR